MVIPLELDTTSIRTVATSLRLAVLWAVTSTILPEASSARVWPLMFLIWSVWPGLWAPDQLKSDLAKAEVGRAAAEASRWRMMSPVGLILGHRGKVTVRKSEHT